MDKISGGGGQNKGLAIVDQLFGGLLLQLGRSLKWGGALYNGVGFVVGNGRSVRFWLDNWVGVGPLCRLFPKLFRLSVNKEASVSDCYEMRNGSIVWRVSFIRSLKLLEWGSYEEMLNLLTNLFLCRDSKDSQIRKPSISR